MNRPRHGYPLAALFLLVAVCAVLTAIVAPIGKALTAEKITLTQMLIAGVSGVFIVSLLGVVIGAFHFRPLRGMGIGALTGAALGLVAGPLVLMPASSTIELFSASIGGSLLLIVVGAVLRLSSGKAS